MKNSKRILALCGGVGGAKLAYGLAKILSEDELTILVNTGDDFEYLDLTICPDIDTVSYTLSDINNTKKGWGIRNESWNTLKFLTKYGAENWFQLGDKDLAVHLYRTFLLKKGMKLQSDPTVIYAINMDHPTRTIQRVYYKDLAYSSPYNTYQNPGLPPGPIKIPALSSIDAVLNYEHHDYLYFVADVTNFGYHKFAKTLTQHNQNKAAYVRWLSQQGVNR